MSKPNKILVQRNKDNQERRAKKPWSSRASAVALTKIEIMKKAREVADNQKLELIAFTKNDHRIHIKNSFGNDPHPPIDQK